MIDDQPISRQLNSPRAVTMTKLQAGADADYLEQMHSPMLVSAQ